MYLIVGLGNPGEKYEHTRHNVGFDVLSLLADKLHIPVRRLHHQALVGEGTFAGQKVALCLPQTYMNLSGDAVEQLLRWYKLPPENLLVIYDDIDLASGWLRIRPNGSAGTHNGMRSIVQSLGTDAFARIRVGIGGKPPAFDLADWVLSHYNTPEERQLAFDAYNRAADAALEWMRGGVQSAMNKYNTQKPKPPKPAKAEAEAARAATPGNGAGETASANPAAPQGADTAAPTATAEGTACSANTTTVCAAPEGETPPQGDAAKPSPATLVSEIHSATNAPPSSGTALSPTAAPGDAAATNDAEETCAAPGRPTGGQA